MKIIFNTYNKILPQLLENNAEYKIFNNLSAAENAILSGEADICVHFLSDLPTIRTQGLTIGAALPRLEVGYSLCVSKNDFEENAILKLRSSATILIKNEIEKAQLLDYRRDFNFSIKNLTNKVINTDVNNFVSEFDNNGMSFLINTYNLSNKINDFYEKHELATIIPLDPTEMIPPPAQGVVVLQHRLFDDNASAWARQYHDVATVRSCNVERKILQNLGSEDYKNRLAAFCKEDQNGNFHLHTAFLNNANELIFNKLSQTSRYLMAENAVKKMM